MQGVKKPQNTETNFYLSLKIIGKIKFIFKVRSNREIGCSFLLPERRIFLLTSHILVIAEKPSVAQSIAAVLGAKGKKDGFIEGNGYLVSWCVGHLIGLAEAAAYGEQYRKWSYDSLPILPQEWKYTVAADKKAQFDTLKDLMRRDDVSEVVNACDAGREGELIFRFVYEVAGCKKPMRRLWISSMEDEAIRDGFSHLKDGRDYDHLFASALCRAKADWIIGINATRLFSCLCNHTLNVGRVQTPTLKIDIVNIS